MKNYYRIMLGAKSIYASEGYNGNYIGAGFLPNIDLTGKISDGKVKYEIQNVEMETDGYNLYFSGNPLTAVAIYNHKGELKYEEAKTKIENYFNSVILVISQFLNGSKVEDKW